jgi:hypothetical protein
MFCVDCRQRRRVSVRKKRRSNPFRVFLTRAAGAAETGVNGRLEEAQKRWHRGGEKETEQKMSHSNGNSTLSGQPLSPLPTVSWNEMRLLKQQLALQQEEIDALRPLDGEVKQLRDELASLHYEMRRRFKQGRASHNHNARMIRFIVHEKKIDLSSFQHYVDLNHPAGSEYGPLSSSEEPSPVIGQPSDAPPRLVQQRKRAGSTPDSQSDDSKRRRLVDAVTPAPNRSGSANASDDEGANDGDYGTERPGERVEAR